jgi:hypothetical protein
MTTAGFVESVGKPNSKEVESSSTVLIVCSQAPHCGMELRLIELTGHVSVDNFVVPAPDPPRHVTWLKAIIRNTCQQFKQEANAFQRVRLLGQQSGPEWQSETSEPESPVVTVRIKPKKARLRWLWKCVSFLILT